MAQYFDGLETREPGEREADLMARLPRQVAHAQQATGAFGELLEGVQASAVATRPRGVRAIIPARTRNGSHTSSTVAASSPTATASVDTPTGPPANRPVPVYPTSVRDGVVYADLDT